MSALTPKADISWRQSNIRFVPKAGIREMTGCKKKDRLAAVSPKIPSRLLVLKDPELMMLGVLVALIEAGSLLRSPESVIHADQDSGLGRFGAEGTAG